MRLLTATILLVFLTGGLALAQNPHELSIIPDSSGSPETGWIRFIESDGWLAGTGGNYVGFRGAASIPADFLWELPSVDGSVNEALCTDGAGVLGWCATGAAGLPVVDTTSIVEGSGDATKEIRIEADGVSTGTVRVWTAPNADIIVAGINLGQTWTANQTFANNWGIGGQDSIGANTGLLKLNGSDFLEFGTINAIDGTGDIIFFRDGGAELKLAWSTADTEGYLGPAFDRTNNFGATDALWDVIRGEDVILGRNTSGTEVQGSIGLHTGHPLFDPALTITGTTIGLVAIDQFSFNAGLHPTVDGFFLGFDDGITVRRWNAKLNNLDVGGTCTGCGEPPFIDWTGSVNALLEDDGDATTHLAIQIDAIPPATTRVWSAQNTNLTVAGIDVAQTWTATQTYDGGNIIIEAPNLIQFMNSTGTLVSHKLTYGGANITDVQDSSGVSMFRFDSSATPDKVFFAADAIPGTNNTFGLGLPTVLWDEANIVDVHAGKPTATRLQGRILFANTDTDATTTASFLGIVKNDGTAAEIAAIEVDNFSIGSSGNFYVRAVSGGDISCTNIDDGWFALATTPNEIQTCDGAAMFLTPYIAASFDPLTLNCTAGQSLEDPRFENGILVEGSCVTR